MFADRSGLEFFAGRVSLMHSYYTVHKALISLHMPVTASFLASGANFDQFDGSYFDLLKNEYLV